MQTAMGGGGRQAYGAEGWSIRAALGYSDKDVIVTRSVVGTSEAGSGKAGLISKALQMEVSYGKLFNDKFLVTPYAGIRYSKISRNSYSEDTTAEVTAPLTYAALAQEQTTTLVGVKAFTQLAPRLTGYASVGLEQDLNYKGGSYIATGVDGIGAFSFNSDINRTRPIASVGATYATKDKQRLNIDFFYKKEAFSSDNVYSATATYSIGF